MTVDLIVCADNRGAFLLAEAARSFLTRPAKVSVKPVTTIGPGAGKRETRFSLLIEMINIYRTGRYKSACFNNKPQRRLVEPSGLIRNSELRSSFRGTEGADNDTVEWNRITRTLCGITAPMLLESRKLNRRGRRDAQRGLGNAGSDFCGERIHFTDLGAAQRKNMCNQRERYHGTLLVYRGFNIG